MGRASDFRVRTRSSPLGDDVDSLLVGVELRARGVEVDFGIDFLGTRSILSELDCACVAEGDLVNCGPLAILSPGKGFEGYSLR